MNPRLPVGLSLLALCVAEVLANPSGGRVTHGEARFAQPDAATLEVRSGSRRTVIEWDAFAIDEGETTRFVQPDAASAVLNRVRGTAPSTLDGLLESNGGVFLINPNGVLIGAQGVIRTAGFTAATLDITDEDFLAGRWRFAGAGDAAVVNAGRIAAGDVLLVGAQVENRGRIDAAGGRIVLAAGRSVTVGERGLDDIVFEVRAPEDGVLNLGELAAPGGAVGLFARSLRHDGVIEAGGVSVDAAGRIVLRAAEDVEIGSGARLGADGADGGRIDIDAGETAWVAGDVHALGIAGRGGRIDLLGRHIALADGGRLLVSGRDGGGLVHIGGGRQGRDPALANAEAVWLAPDSLVAADALRQGDGGSVIVWSERATQALGRLQARGGALGGDGGFIETSGRLGLRLGAHVPDLAAPAGTPGTWLIDPTDIAIRSAPITGEADLGAGPVFSADGDLLNSTGAWIDVNALLSALDNGTAVVIDTSGAGHVDNEQGHVNFDAPLLVTGSGGSLTVNADGDININQPIGVAPGGAFDLTLNADTDNDGSGGYLNVFATVATGGGDFTADAPAGIYLSGGQGTVVDTGGGALTISTASSLSFSDPAALRGGAVTLSASDITGYGFEGSPIDPVIVADTLVLRTTQSVGSADGTFYSFLDVSATRLDVDNTGAGGLLLRNQGAVTVDALRTAGGPLRFYNQGDVTVLGPVVHGGLPLGGGGLGQAAAGAVTPADGTAGALLDVAGGDLTIRGAVVDVALGDLALAVDGAVNLDGSGGGLSVATVGDLLVDAAALNATGGGGDEGFVNLSADGALTMNLGGNLVLAGGDGSGSAVFLGGETVDVTAAALELTGGAGVGAEVGLGGNSLLAITVTDGIRLTGGGGDGAAATLGGNGGDDGAPTTVRILGAGDIVLQGGAGTDALAGIGDGTAGAQVWIGVDAQGGPRPYAGRIVLQSGTGAAGTTSESFGALAGIGSSIRDAQVTVVATGDIELRGGPDRPAFLGSIDGGGRIDLTTDGRLVLADGALWAAQRTVSAAGGVFLDAGVLRLDGQTGGGGLWTIGTGATLALEGEFDLQGAAAIDNRGRIDWLGGALRAPDAAARLINRAGGEIVFEGGGLIEPLLDTRGRVELRNGSLVDLSGGVLMANGRVEGEGVLRTPLFDQTGGVLAPGLGAGVLDPEAQAGRIVIDGDWRQGADAVLEIDLFGAEAVGQTVVPYDRLAVSGTAVLDGLLRIDVNVGQYRGAIGDAFLPLVFGAVEGGFAALEARPEGYGFAYRLVDGRPTLLMSARPRLGDITLGEERAEDELQTLLMEQLREQFERRLERAERERLERLGEDAEARRKRRAQSCS